MRKLETAFRYFEIKDRIESYADGILKPHGFRSRLLPVLTTGVQGDFGTYRFPLAIENCSGKDHDLKNLAEISTRLTNEIVEINRVVLLIGGSIKDETLADGYFFR